MTRTPFAARGSVDAGAIPAAEQLLELSYDPELQRNRIRFQGEWIDSARCPDHISADTLLTMTSHATMTRQSGEVGEGSKLDDDG
jgi:hypothetical protein